MARPLVREVNPTPAIVELLKRAELERPLDLTNRKVFVALDWTHDGFTARRVVIGAATACLAGDTCEVEWVAGERYREWLGDMSEAICKAAQAQNATLITAYGRRGWKRPLEALGWRFIGSQDGMAGYEKAL